MPVASVTLSPLERNITRTDIECPGDLIPYNCSVLSNSEEVQLTWEVTFPDQTHFNITYNNSSMPNTTDDLGANITSVLTRYTSDEYIESLLVITVLKNASMNGTQVECRSEALDHKTAFVHINISGNYSMYATQFKLYLV